MIATGASKLLKEHAGLIGQVARRYRNRGVDWEDLVQEGRCALLLAAERFDESRGVKFITYAQHYVNGYLLALCNRMGGQLRMGSSHAERRFRGALRDGATLEDAAALLGRVADHERAQIVGRQLVKDVPLDGLGPADAHRYEPLADLPPPDEGLQARQWRAWLTAALPTLPARERQIVELRHLREQPLTLAQVGRRLDLSRERIRQLEEGAIKRLREFIEEARPADRARVLAQVPSASALPSAPQPCLRPMPNKETTVLHALPPRRTSGPDLMTPGPRPALPAAAPAAPGAPSRAQPLAVLVADAAPVPRILSGLEPFDRVLGGGLVPGSLVVLGGEPGVGKSTLLLHALDRLAAPPGDGAAPREVLYVTGEETLERAAERAQRLGVAAPGLHALAETNLQTILKEATALRPAVLAIDSIQTVNAGAPGAVGSLRQVRAAIDRLMAFAKEHGVAILLIGHVTKNAALAGPKSMEHYVDAVLQFDSDGGPRRRLWVPRKNRFGATTEVGHFRMTGAGLEPLPPEDDGEPAAAASPLRAASAAASLPLPPPRKDAAPRSPLAAHLDRLLGAPEPATSEVAPVDSAPGLALLTHRLPLRPGVVASCHLPADLSHRDVDRLCRFLDVVPFDEAASPASASPELLTHKLQLRPGLGVSLALPEDLGAADVRRLSRFLRTLPLEEVGAAAPAGPQTPAARREAVEAILLDPQLRTLSDRQIGRDCHVNQSTVTRLRRALEAEGLIDETSARLGADGKRRRPPERAGEEDDAGRALGGNHLPAGEQMAELQLLGVPADGEVLPDAPTSGEPPTGQAHPLPDAVAQVEPQGAAAAPDQSEPRAGRTDLRQAVVELLAASEPEGSSGVAAALRLGADRSSVGRMLRALEASGAAYRTGGERGPNVRFHLRRRPEDEAPAAANGDAPAPSFVEAAAAPAAPVAEDAAAPAPCAAALLIEAEAAAAERDWPAAYRAACNGLEALGAAYVCAVGGRSQAGVDKLLTALRLRVNGRPADDEPPELSESSPPELASRSVPTLLLVGGLGRLETRYRQVVEEAGYDLLYIENSQSMMESRGRTVRPAAVVLFTTVVSHPLRQKAAEVAATADAPILYVEEPSQSSLRRALRRLTQHRDSEAHA